MFYSFYFASTRGAKRSIAMSVSVCLSVRSHILTRAQELLRWATVWPQQTWAEKWGRLLCPFPWKELSSHLTQCHVAWAEANLRTKWHFDPSNRLATIHQRYRETRRRCRSIGRTVTRHGCPIKPVHIVVIRRYAIWLKVTPVYAIISPLMTKRWLIWVRTA